MAEWTEMKIGDHVSVPVPIYRRWWQFWKPKVIGHRNESYVIVSSSTSAGDRWPMRVRD